MNVKWCSFVSCLTFLCGSLNSRKFLLPSPSFCLFQHTKKGPNYFSSWIQIPVPLHIAPDYKWVGWQNPLMPYVWEFLKFHTFKGFMDKTDRNWPEDFCHPPGAVCSGLLSHEISLKKWKRQKKKKFKGHIKDQIQKKTDFLYFFPLIWSNGLENSVNVFGLTFKAIKTKKTIQRPNICK